MLGHRPYSGLRGVVPGSPVQLHADTDAALRAKAYREWVAWAISEDEPGLALPPQYPQYDEHKPTTMDKDQVSPVSVADQSTDLGSNSTEDDDHAQVPEDSADQLAAEIRALRATTLMLHGVPNRLMCDDLLPVFEGLGFSQDDFDYMYMPLDNRAIAGLKRKSNLGYMFVNCASPDVAARLAVLIFDHQFSARRSTKPVHATLATTQGVAPNVQLLINSWRKTKRLRKSRANLVWLRRGKDWFANPVEQLAAEYS